MARIRTCAPQEFTFASTPDGCGVYTEEHMTTQEVGLAANPREKYFWLPEVRQTVALLQQTTRGTAC